MLLIMLLMAKQGDETIIKRLLIKLESKATFLATKPPLPLGPVVLTF